eukprot:1349592-Amorphochlora_amoeboformis.AAC.1
MLEIAGDSGDRMEIESHGAKRAKPALPGTTRYSLGFRPLDRGRDVTSCHAPEHFFLLGEGRED